MKMTLKTLVDVNFSIYHVYRQNDTPINATNKITAMAEVLIFEATF